MSPPSISALSARQKQLVRESFESVREYSESVVLLFYGRLFEIAPEARRLFKVEIREQSRKLLDTLTALVDSLDRFEELCPQLAEMGRRHLGYGVKPEDYETLRGALLWSFGQALGIEFSRETRAAWEQLIKIVSEVMLEGAASAAPQAVKQEHP